MKQAKKDVTGFLVFLIALALFAWWVSSGNTTTSGGGKAVKIETPKVQSDGVFTVIDRRIDFLRYCREHRIVVAFFTAEWCNPCEKAKPEWQQLTDDFSDLATHVLIDVDAVPALQRRFGVDEIPTWVVLVGGDEVFRVTGYSPGLESLKRAIERAQ